MKRTALITGLLGITLLVGCTAGPSTPGGNEATPTRPPATEPSPTTETVDEQSPSPTPSPAEPSPTATGGEGTPSPTSSAVPSKTATELESETDCSDEDPQQGVVQFSWTPSATRGDAQRIDITTVRGGFERGQFTSLDEIGPELSSLRWEEVQGQAIHFWRVMTLHGDQWAASETAEFEGPTCIADYEQ